MVPPGPRPPGPETVMPQEWGSDRRMRSARPSGKPTNRSGRPSIRLGLLGCGEGVKPKRYQPSL